MLTILVVVVIIGFGLFTGLLYSVATYVPDELKKEDEFLDELDCLTKSSYGDR